MSGSGTPQDLPHNLAVKGVEKAIKKLDKKIEHHERLNPQFYRIVNGVQVPNPRPCDDQIAELKAEKQERQDELRKLLENPPQPSGSGSDPKPSSG